jgi:hypothetical protein
MTIDLFIPTVPAHITHLDKIFSLYETSTVLPTNIYVSVTQYEECKDEVSILENKWKNITFLKTNDKLLAGPNRQRSKEFCNSDIIVYHDSDDYPHIQRLEIIKYFFENYDILHLNHSYDNKTAYNEKHIDIQNISTVNSVDIYKKYFPSNIITECKNSTYAYGGCFNWIVQAGVPAIKKRSIRMY